MSNQQKNIRRWPKRWREMLEDQPWSAPPVKRVKSPALQYLLMIQWSSGNGQCGDCWGVSPLWLGDFRYPVIDYCGHEPGCVLAAAIEDAGGDVLYWKVPHDKRKLGTVE